MHELLQRATREVARFLSEKLPQLTEDWWTELVIERLTFQQQRLLSERQISSLEELDLAALLRVFDQSWYDLKRNCGLPYEGRTWLKELQAVRNRWAHLGALSPDPQDTYRDADTLSRFLGAISSEAEILAAVEQLKSESMRAMAEGSIAAEPASQDSVEEPESNGGHRSSLYSPGDLVALRSDATIVVPVVAVEPSAAETRYVVFRDGRKVTYYESQLQLHNVDKGRVSLDADALRALMTGIHLLAPSVSNLYSLRAGRIQFVPYQYRPVLKFIRADRPRLLIADEVGVGKTIEAGLIIKELKARSTIRSVLIICPKALVAERKWELEMRRFDERFTALDGKLLRHCIKETHLDGEWPEQFSHSILPFSLFDSSLVFGEQGSKRGWGGLLALDPPPKFDLVIVDEAHHIRNPETYLHQGVRYFCDNAEAVVFLTATPVQLGSGDLFRILNVLRPDLIIDEPSFEQMAAPNRHLNSAIRDCRGASDGWEDRARKSMAEAAQTSWGRHFLREAPSFQQAYDQLTESEISDQDRVSLIRELEELCTFSSIINRTRRRDIGEFTIRKPETVVTEFTEPQRQLHDDLMDLVARILVHAHGQQNVKFMMTTVRRQASSCLFGLAPLLRNMLSGKVDALEVMESADSEYEPDFEFVQEMRAEAEALAERAEQLDAYDPKAEAFLTVLRGKASMENNKALVFSTFRHTLRYLEGRVAEEGLRYGLIHGDVPDEERSELRRRFALGADNPDAIEVLLSSEVGCEGLDFQFCDLLINYDIPWNPMRIEQRIGRIDRFGQQSEAVAIFNLITPGTVDADIYERCLLRIGVFQHAIGGSEEILGELTKEMHGVADSFGLSPDERAQKLQQLGDNAIRLIHEEETLEKKQAELFGLAVPGLAPGQDVMDLESAWLRPQLLQNCVSSYLMAIAGSESEHLLGDRELKTLRLNQDGRLSLLEDFKSLRRSNDTSFRLWERWLKGSDPMLQVTFDQDTAAANPNVAFLDVYHPLVRQAARHHDKPDAVEVRVRCESAVLPAGEYPFALYQWKKAGARGDSEIIVVCLDADIEENLAALLVKATSDEGLGSQLSPEVEQELDTRHHQLWRDAQAAHYESNKVLVEHRIHSLKASHRARCALLQDQIASASDAKIVRMKESELARAQRNLEQMVEELERAQGRADIHSTLRVLGTLTIAAGGAYVSH